MSGVHVTPMKTVEPGPDGTDGAVGYGVSVESPGNTVFIPGLERGQVVGVPPSDLVRLARELSPEVADMTQFSEQGSDSVTVAGVGRAWSALFAAGLECLGTSAAVRARHGLPPAPRR